MTRRMTGRLSRSMGRPMIDILQASRDPHLFGPWFKDRISWAPWFAFLAALFGLPMDDAQLDVFRRCTGRTTPPTAPSDEAWLIIGRRGGKSFVMALVAVYLAAFRDCRQYLQPGERATVGVIAADRKQARVIIRYVHGLLHGVRMLKKMVEAERAESFDLNNGNTIEVMTASLRSTRGYTYLAVLLDEIAFFRTDDSSAHVDAEILTAVRPGLVTIPGSMLLAASSPYSRRGELWNAYRKWYGQNDAPLVWAAPTKVMNPSVPQKVIDRAIERDPDAASAEFLAQFRSDLEDFVKREVVDACVAEGVREHPPRDGVAYRAFVDPSGGSADSFTMAIAHRGPEGGVLDLVRERKPPFSPSSVVAEYCEDLKRYGITEVLGDAYAGMWPREKFRHHGIEYRVSDMPRSDLYRTLLPELNSRSVVLLDNDRLIAQLCSLERRVGRSGKDIIDHPLHQHDDLANAAAGALVACAKPKGKSFEWYVNGKFIDGDNNVRRAAASAVPRYAEPVTGLSDARKTPWQRVF